MKPFIKLIRDITINDIPEVGGKNASLGEMFKHLEPKGVRIPDGFVVTASAYRHFITEGRVKDVVLKDFIEQTLKGLRTKDLKQLQHVGKLIREAIISAHMPEDL